MELKRGRRSRVQIKMVEFFRLPVPVVKKLKICSFHVVVVQRRQRNVQNKRDARAELLFCLLILLLFDAAVAVAVAVLVLSRELKIRRRRRQTKRC